MSAAKIKYITAVVLYGTIGMILQFIDAPSEFVVLCRGLIGTITILLITCLGGRKIGVDSIKKNFWILIASGACLGLNWIFLFRAYIVTTVAIASLCNYTAPIITILILALASKKLPDFIQILCIIAAVVGIVFISGVVDGGDAEVNVLGIVLGMAASAAFVGIILLNRQLKEIDAIDKAMVQLFVSAIVVLPYVLFMNGGLPVVRDVKSIILILMLGILHTGVAYIMYFGGLSEISVESVAILGYLEPVISIILCAIVLHQNLTLFGVIGAVLILGSAVFNEYMQAVKSK